MIESCIFIYLLLWQDIKDIYGIYEPKEREWNLHFPELFPLSIQSMCGDKTGWVMCRLEGEACFLWNNKSPSFQNLLKKWELWLEFFPILETLVCLVNKTSSTFKKRRKLAYYHKIYCGILDWRNKSWIKKGNYGK